MKIIVTTSSKYLHIIPVFCTLYNRYWGNPFELVGYEKPENLPLNCTFVSLGNNSEPKKFTNDLRAYFSSQTDKFFTWIMEDTLLREGVDHQQLYEAEVMMEDDVGKFCLTNESMRREHEILGPLFFVSQQANYRLSSQPAIWNRDYLVNSMKPNLNPWEWESQHPKDDGFEIMGFIKNTVTHNEGVTKKDIHKLNLEGIQL